MSTTISQRHHPRTVAESLGGTRATKAGAIVGLVLLAVGSIGPWANVLAISVNGTRGDGKMTLTMATISVCAVLVGRKGPLALATTLTVVCVLIVGYDLVHVERAVGHTTLLAVSAGWGLYVALAGAIVALFALAGEYVDS